MTERERIQRALEPLHASGQTLEEVFKMAARQENGYKKHTGRSVMRTALVAAAAAAALTVTAYAVGAYTGFFETVFGNEDIAGWNAEHVTLTDENGNVWEEYDVPGQERVPVDAEAAEALVGDETASVGQSVKVEDVTFTVENIVMDANGMGVLTYTMEDPNGFPGVEFTETGGMLTEDPTMVGTLRGATMCFADADGREMNFLDEDSIVAAGGTATRKTVAMYFAPFQGLEEAESLKLTFHVVKEHDPDATLAADVVAEGGVIFPLSQAVAATPLTGANGWSASISPVGLQIVPPEGNPYGQNYFFNDLAIHMADGTDYALKQGEPDLYNITVGCYGEDYRTNYTFNRLIDPAQVESVTAVGDAAGYKDENGQTVRWDQVSPDGETLREGLSEFRDTLELTFTK